MVTHMKTTIDISDALLHDAKAAAARRSTTLRALVEEGLREVLRGDSDEGPVTLRDASVGGGWVSGEFAGAGWEGLAEAAYGRPGA